ncbi:MAG: Gfo/Idh/MocA family oxidoreductase [Candidatus Manganitrophus sp.]|nr:Gfo/Idh/MocA family oxidoreductase [Candidatus Manganitrophus sp.]
MAIAAPASLHFELAKKVLEDGKDVYIEKPLALDVNEGALLVELAEKEEQDLNGRPSSSIPSCDFEIEGIDQ